MDATTPILPPSTLNSVLTMLATKGLAVLAAFLVTHGVMTGSNTEAFVALAPALVSLGWSAYMEYLRPILSAQLEVLKAKSLAQAAALNAAGAPKVTVAQIAAQSPTMEAPDVVKAIATLPPEIREGVVPPAPAASRVVPPAPLVVFAVALAALVLGYGSPAYAQARKLPNPLNLPDPLNIAQKSTATPAVGTNGGFAQIGAQLQKLTKDIVDKAITDVTAANVDAGIRNDQIAQPCWQAQLAFMQLLPIEWVATPANGSTPATPGPPAEIGPALGFQVARDLMEAITGNDKGSLKVACAALIGDQLNILNQVLGLVGIGAVTGLPVGL